MSQCAEWTNHYKFWVGIKEIWYGRDPVVISIQLTNFQSLIGLMFHGVARIEGTFNVSEHERMKFLQYGTGCSGECSEVTESTIPYLLKDIIKYYAHTLFSKRECT